VLLRLAHALDGSQNHAENQHADRNDSHGLPEGVGVSLTLQPLFDQVLLEGCVVAADFTLVVFDVGDAPDVFPLPFLPLPLLEEDCGEEDQSHAEHECDDGRPNEGVLHGAGQNHAQAEQED